MTEPIASKHGLWHPGADDSCRWERKHPAGTGFVCTTHGAEPHDAPDYVVGVDPALDPAESTMVVALRCPCGTLATGASIEECTASMEQHRFVVHDASRNPEITCQAAPPWDHERWCLRPKGHTGDHWTPGAGGGRWWHGDWS